jgi:glyoxylase-like metal-dependent hydrolase (beta-lactamase superfamily II)
MMGRPARVCDGVYIIGSSDISGPMDCCVYLVDAGQLVMVDAGAGGSADRLIDNIQALGLVHERLSTIIVTHAHIDHIGSLAELKEKYGLSVIAHEGDAAAIESGKKVGAEYYGVKYRPCKVDVTLKGPENSLTLGAYEFRFLHVPGHTPGSIVASIKSEGKTVLFGQDIHGPYLAMWGGDAHKAGESLEKIKAIKADILCEGHYGVIQPADEVSDFIQEFIDGLKGK